MQHTHVSYWIACIPNPTQASNFSFLLCESQKGNDDNLMEWILTTSVETWTAILNFTLLCSNSSRQLWVLCYSTSRQCLGYLHPIFECQLELSSLCLQSAVLLMNLKRQWMMGRAWDGHLGTCHLYVWETRIVVLIPFQPIPAPALAAHLHSLCLLVTLFTNKLIMN